MSPQKLSAIFNGHRRLSVRRWSLPASAAALLAMLVVAAPAAAKQPAPHVVQPEEAYDAAPSPEAYGHAPNEPGVYGPGPYGPEEPYFDEGCPTCHSADACCCDMGRLSAGYAFVLVQPHLEDDLAFTNTVADTGFSATSDTTFDNEMELSPRVWLEYGRMNGLGVKVTYWQFDHSSPDRSATPAATGFETITTPTFGDFELTTAIPGEQISAASDIDVDSLDFEGTKWTQFECWRLGTTGGLRYASVAQGYQAALRDANGGFVGAIHSRHRFDGLGPTFSIEGRRPFGCLTFYSMARGSLLFGNGKFGFTAVDNLAATTLRTSLERNDVLTVAEIGVGIEWRRQCCNGNMFFCRTALEGQVWQGAGSATSEDGDLGFFGLNVALGMSL